MTPGKKPVIALRNNHYMKHALKTLPALLVMTNLFATAAFCATVHFDDAKPGALPAGWTGTNTGDGKPKWTVEKDDSAPSKSNVLKQGGEADYPVALQAGPKIKDGFVEVKFKAVSGEQDQAGGVIWRAQDANNYYIARANALEGNVRIYHFVQGKRTQFKGVSAKVASGQWHTLRVNFAGQSFAVIFNGQELFTAEDQTLKDAGQVGVWTKADSVTLFDDFSSGGK